MDIRRIVAELIASKAIAKGTKTMIKLGGDKVSCTVFSDGEKIWYEVNVDIIDYIDKNVYRKTHNVYHLPYEVIPSTELSARAAIDMYQEYLVDSSVEYVDSNNKRVEWQEHKQNSIGIR